MHLFKIVTFWKNSVTSLNYERSCLLLTTGLIFVVHIRYANFVIKDFFMCTGGCQFQNLLISRMILYVTNNVFSKKNTDSFNS